LYGNFSLTTRRPSRLTSTIESPWIPAIAITRGSRLATGSNGIGAIQAFAHVSHRHSDGAGDADEIALIRVHAATRERRNVQAVLASILEPMRAARLVVGHPEAERGLARRADAHWVELQAGVVMPEQTEAGKKTPLLLDR